MSLKKVFNTLANPVEKAVVWAFGDETSPAKAASTSAVLTGAALLLGVASGVGGFIGYFFIMMGVQYAGKGVADVCKKHLESQQTPKP